MNIREYLLACLAEEASEVTKDSLKAQRFGIDDFNPHDTKVPPPKNWERIVAELNDLLAVADLLTDPQYGPPVLPKDWNDPEAQRLKKMKLLKYMGYARERGTLEMVKLTGSSERPPFPPVEFRQFG